jgi:chromosome segregation ATPase
MTESTLPLVLIGLIILGMALLTGVMTLIFVAGGTRRQVRRISYILDERYTQLDTELEQARQDHLQAQRKIQQLEERLEEERPEKLKWELQHATDELERWREEYSELQRQVEQQKQEWLHQAEQQNQQLLRLEQEQQHLMEELERWHDRYTKAQQQVEQLKQERSEDQRKVEQLMQLRARLLEEN